MVLYSVRTNADRKCNPLHLRESVCMCLIQQKCDIRSNYKTLFQRTVKTLFVLLISVFALNSATQELTV